VLHADAQCEGEECLVLEALESGFDLGNTLARLLKWAQGLPPAARRSWVAASRRVFDIGINGGLRPHESHWTIRHDQVATVAKLGAEVVLTIYGAESRNRTVATRASSRPSRRTER
jgi:hypothetical protein